MANPNWKNQTIWTGDDPAVAEEKDKRLRMPGMTTYSTQKEQTIIQELVDCLERCVLQATFSSGRFRKPDGTNTLPRIKE